MYKDEDQFVRGQKIKLVFSIVIVLIALLFGDSPFK